MADEMVLKTQKWLNAMYYGNPGYYSEKIPENGNTGWTTIYALIRALQIELGIQDTADSFGPTTIKEFNKKFKYGIQQQADGETTTDRIYAIIQGACWCKGYSTGASGITENFYGGTGGAIKKLKADAGIADTTSTVTLNVMKALLSMDQFKLTTFYGGIPKIRTIQQRLNRKYEDYIGLIPCDGVYGRQMNKSMIIALQKIEGYSKEEATGNFGDGTKSRLPRVPFVGIPTPAEQQQTEDAIELIRYALCCNGYTDVDIDSNIFDNVFSDWIGQFQSDMLLERTNTCNVDTWMALLLSKGNPDRAFNAADTAYTIYNGDTGLDRTNILKGAGIKVVGRYITGDQGKQLKFDEAQGMLDNGISFYPIFQRDGKPSVGYFTEQQAILDAEHAYKRAKNYCIPENSIIYFAVDIDMQDAEITNYAIPYFRALNNVFSKYRIGVYGTRNLCSRVMENNYAVTCLVSDASSGYSGNMGFKMPDNWNFDQFVVDYPLTPDFYIDKNIFSNKFPVVTKLAPRDFYTGKITISEKNNGRAIRYAGRKLELNVSAIGENGEKLEDLYAIVHVANLQPFPDPFCSTGTVFAKVDGKNYDLRTEELFDINGNPVERSSIFISDEIDYRLEYYIAKKISDGVYQAVTDKNVTIEVEVSTYYI